MKRFTRLYLDLDATTSTTAKVEALSAYFGDAAPADAAWTTALLLGQRPKRAITSRQLMELASAMAQVPAWMIDECRAAVGDLSETIALLLPESSGIASEGWTLREVMAERVQPLASLPAEQRQESICGALSMLDRDERLVFLKLIRGGFRVGVQRRMLSRALADVAGVDRSTIEQRLTGGFDPTAEAFEALVSQEGPSDLERRPYPFFLASQIDVDPSSLGERLHWIAEWKWDGIRAQLVRRSGVSLWSRGEELIGDLFPEITAAAEGLPAGTVLDGEVLMWTGDRPGTFASLQSRLQRRDPPPPQLELFASESPVFMAFDALEVDGEELRASTSRDRRRALEGLVRCEGGRGAIRLSTVLEDPTWQALAESRERSRERGVEGIMLKHAGGVYGVGRTRAADGRGWWKWKVDPLTADAVMVYAYPGSGRRATLYTDYAFAVWDGSGAERELVVFTRAYSGLTQEEIEGLDRWIRRNTVRTMGPARMVKPERVFEIGFEGIERSRRHKAGVAVRFPRILRERVDKEPAAADTLESLVALIDGGRGALEERSP